MRDWQVERRKRTRHLIELGGLVVELAGDDRVVIYGALLWVASKLRSEQGEQARSLWAEKGAQAFEEDRHERKLTVASHQRFNRL